MQISELKEQIREGKFDNFYVFGGEEWAVQRIYIQKISEASDLPIRYINSINDIYSRIKNPSFLDLHYCYVVRDDADILSNEKLQNQLLHGLMKKNILILILTQIDKRLKGFKNLEYKYISFDKMPVETLKKYVKSQINLSDKNCERLINICEQDYGRILLEIDKINSFGNSLTSQIYKENVNKDDDKIFEHLVENGIIYIPPEDAVFDLVDAVLKRKVNLSYELLNECVNIGEANLVILQNLYTATKQLLQVQSCESSDIMETCGITYPQMKAAQSRLNKYSISELIDLLKEIRLTEKQIKIGEMEDSLSVEYILVKHLF